MFEVFGNAFLFGVAEKSAETTGVEMIEDGDEEMLVEFEGVWKLTTNLPDAVYEL